MANGDTKTEQMLDVLGNGGDASQFRGCCNTKTQNYILDAIDRVQKVEDDVEEMKNNPDVVDIVDTYADLQAYDTSKLTDKDVVRVLNDETHDGESTYYRYDKHNDVWTYIGTTKQYTDFVGTDGQTAGVAGLVPAPATTDTDKYLKSDGSWATVDAGPTVVQTTGTSTTDVMSQNATSSMVFADPSTRKKVQIGEGASTDASSGGEGEDRMLAIGYRAKARAGLDIAIGVDALASASSGYRYAIARNIAIGYLASAGNYKSGNDGVGLAIAIGNHATASYFTTIALGANSLASAEGSIAIGSHGGYFAPQASARAAIAIGEGSTATKSGAIACGAYSSATTAGQMDIGSSNTSFGYNNSNYRLLTGLYDPQYAHDAATKGYVDGTTETYTIATTDWTALANSAPYTYQATVTATYTVGANTIAELLNDNPVEFATYGFAIGDITGQTVTIYSIGQPSASETLKINYKG